MARVLGDPAALKLVERYGPTALGPVRLELDGLTIGCGRARVYLEGEPPEACGLAAGADGLIWSSADLPVRAALDLGRGFAGGLMRAADGPVEAVQPAAGPPTAGPS